VPDQFAASFMALVKSNPEYFSDLPPLPAAKPLNPRSVYLL
jgi:hypothetical protein